MLHHNMRLSGVTPVGRARAAELLHWVGRGGVFSFTLVVNASIFGPGVSWGTQRMVVREARQFDDVASSLPAFAE